MIPVQLSSSRYYVDSITTYIVHQLECTLNAKTICIYVGKLGYSDTEI
jgi:hypothetical protein